LRLILRRVWPRAFVLEHLSEITAIDPAAAGRAADEMIDLVLGRIADAPDRLPEAAARGQGQAARLGVRPLVLDRAAAHCFPSKSARRSWDAALQYLFDHVFLDRSRQNLPHEFSHAQMSQRCNERKVADSARREWEITRYLLASIPHCYRDLRRSRTVCDYLLRDFLGLPRVSNTDRPLRRNSPPVGIAQVRGCAAMQNVSSQADAES